MSYYNRTTAALQSKELGRSSSEIKDGRRDGVDFRQSRQCVRGEKGEGSSPAGNLRLRGRSGVSLERGIVSRLVLLSLSFSLSPQSVCGEEIPVLHLLCSLLCCPFVPEGIGGEAQMAPCFSSVLCVIERTWVVSVPGSGLAGPW